LFFHRNDEVCQILLGQFVQELFGATLPELARG
jgi:hypothetical protein